MIRAKDMKNIVGPFHKRRDILESIQHWMCYFAVKGSYCCSYRANITEDRADAVLTELKDNGYEVNLYVDELNKDVKIFDISWREV